MKKVKIGVVDKEKEYVLDLITYLQRYGNGKWELSAFTKEEILFSYLKDHTLDFLLVTDKNLWNSDIEETSLVKIWMTDEKQKGKDGMEKEYSIYRFQSASEIGKQMEEIIRREHKPVRSGNLFVAVYSPVGRCGKTTMALEVVKSGKYGKWLYFGMEDYSSFLESERQNLSDEILYYWKEEKRDKFLKALEQIEDVIVTGTSFFDIKKIGMKDMNWLKETLEQSGYQGVVFDIGSGVLQDFQMFKVFQYIIVPYLEEERGRIKKENFETLFSLQGMKDFKERLVFVDMDNKKEIDGLMERIFGGDRI